MRLRDRRIVSVVGATMLSRNSPPSTFLHLLAPDGIVRVSFSRALSADECISLLDAADVAANARALEQSLQELGDACGIQTVTEIVSRKRVGVAS
jgi:hypothetical protein